MPVLLRGVQFQDSQLLEPHMNLVDQCVQGEGLVQINVELKCEGGLKKINIMDVLKPPDDPMRLYLLRS